MYPRTFGKYVLQRQLAVGGMAEIYLARANGPAGFEKECVIKRISSRLATDEQFVRMFLDEARIAARLSHPNIAQIYDLGQLPSGDGQDFFIAMEYVAGVDLEQIIDAEKARGGRVPIPIALRIIAQAADGLDHAHKALDMRGQPLGLVHRDVSPSNVMVSFDGIAKVLDFGIAKATPTKVQTEVGIIKGKLPYMSPEQVEGQPVDARSDVFALGTVIYELTVGKRPFDGNSVGEVSLQVLKNEPRPAVLTVRDYPDALSAILAKTHNKRRSERYQSARELQIALEKLLGELHAPSTTHDVAAYLSELFPGLRERTIESDAQAADVAMKEGAAPTVPALATPSHGGLVVVADGLVTEAGAVGSELDVDPTQPERPAATRLPTPFRGSRGAAAALSPSVKNVATPPQASSMAMAASKGTEMETNSNRGPEPSGDMPIVIGDLSSSQLGNYEDVRRNLGGSGYGSIAVVAVLIVGVAFAFWWLRRGSTPTPAPTATAAPVTAKPPVAAAPPAPAPTPPVKVEAPAPAEAPPVAAAPVAAAPVADEPVKAVKPKHESKPAAHHHEHHHDDGPRTLPHLPGAPPPDDNPE